MNSEPEDVEIAGIRIVLAAVFLLVVTGGVIDLILDRPDSLLSAHVLFEVFLVLVSLVAASYLAWGWYRSQARLAVTERDARRLREEREFWESRAQDALDGLSRALSSQFDLWELTNAERRTALMMLQGMSHKRIAKLTATSERTVRQHAVAVYRKSGLSGRAALSGFFLGPLLIEEGPAGPPAPAGEEGE